MKDFLNFLKDFGSSVNDRLKFPLFSAFLISWAVLNWQGIFIILFSDQPIEARILLVNKEYSDIWLNMLYPLILSIGYTVITPLLKKGLYWMLSGINMDNRDNDMSYLISSYKKKIELAQAEVRLEVEREKHRELSDYNEMVEKLRAEVASEKEEKESLRDEIKQMDASREKSLRRFQDEMSALRQSLDALTNDNELLLDLVNRYALESEEIFNDTKKLIFDRDRRDEAGIAKVLLRIEGKLEALNDHRTLLKKK